MKKKYPFFEKLMQYAVLLLLLMIGSVFPLISAESGDVNEDESINIVDALLVAQYYVGLDPASFNADYGDVDCTGTINIVDALLIAQYYVGLINSFPCDETSPPTPDGTMGPTAVVTEPPTPGPTDVPSTLKVQYKCGEPNTTVQQIRPYINIVNTGSSSIPLSDLTVRYWYTKDGSAAEEFHVDYAGMGSAALSGSFGSNYCEIGFSSNAGTLQNSAQTGEIQLRINKTDWSSYNQADDWSFDATKTSFADWDRITLYRSGTLVWGYEDDGTTPSPTPVPTDTPPPTETPGPTEVSTPSPTPIGNIPTPGTTNSLGAPVIRLNQAGYESNDPYKTAVVAGTGGTFTIHDAITQNEVYSGTCTSRGTDSGTGETLYTADFSSFTTPGTYYLMVGSEPSYRFEIRNDLYNRVLYYTLRVYGANRCGPYDSWIHGHCHTLDGSIRGSGDAGSLVGGWHDCGDHVKFGGTLGYASAMLLYACIAFPGSFGDVYSMSYDGTYTGPSPDGIPDVLNEVKVATDYILNLYDASVEDGLISSNQMYYQVGDGDDDHSWWHKPEYQDDFGQSKGGAPREVWSDITSGVAGRFSATLTMMALCYEDYDAAYAARCLSAAKPIYNIACNRYGQSGYSGGKGYYQADGRMDDDMALAAIMLYRATGDDSYINDTEGAAYWMHVENKWQFASFHALSFPNVFSLALHAYYQHAPTVDNSEPEVDTVIVTKDECIEWLRLDVDRAAEPDVYGRKWEYGWGTCRYMMGVAATAALAHDLDPSDDAMLKVAKDQMNWVFGCNQFGMSFVVGNAEDNWLTRYPRHPHHRAANPDGMNVPELTTYEATELTGATIGGPSAHTTFSDRWDDYTSTETGIDYWAGTFFTAAYFIKQ
jgi:hypothetical protein